MIKTFLFFLLLIPSFSVAQSSISGVITYYFNQTQGNKVDLGAKVYLADSSGLTECLDSFLVVKFYRELISMYNTEQQKYLELKRKKRNGAEVYKSDLERIQNVLDDAKAKMVKYHAETEAKFKAIDERAWKSLYLISKNASSRTVDGSGNYSFNNVKKGSYSLYIVSKHRTGNSIIEVTGKVHGEKINIDENQTKDISYNFDLF